MINNALDIAVWRRELDARGRVQVRDYLQPDAADALHACLADQVPWQIAHNSTGTSVTTDRGEALDAEHERGLLTSAYARARDEYQFAFDSYMLVRAVKEGWDPDLLVHHLLAFFNSPQHLEFARHLTGDGDIRSINAQATRYRPGQFLKLHSDINSEEDWRYAYVLNLSRDWQADWGGLLHFVDDAGAVVETFVPRWNSLSLFKVPTGHFVSLVAPWARAPRLAVTGWFRA
ncbi:MAG: 2OG-Fe(II) oxygenase family protein [Luteimonas sp.]